MNWTRMTSGPGYVARGKHGTFWIEREPNVLGIMKWCLSIRNAGETRAYVWEYYRTLSEAKAEAERLEA